MSVEALKAEKVGCLEDKYLTSRLMGMFLPRIAGEKGADLINFYNYFRWVDDVVDEGPMSRDDKKYFMERQMNITEVVRGNRDELPFNMSKEELDFYNNLNKDRKLKNEVVTQAWILLSTIKDDINREYIPRTKRELRHYNFRVVLSSVRAAAMIGNEKELKEKKEFAEFLQTWTSSASCVDVREDFEKGMVHFPFSEVEIDKIQKMGISKRKEYIKENMRDKYKEHKNYVVNNMGRQSLSIFGQEEVPLWQKLFTVATCSTRSCIKVINSSYNI